MDKWLHRSALRRITTFGLVVFAGASVSLVVAGDAQAAGRTTLSAIAPKPPKPVKPTPPAKPDSSAVAISGPASVKSGSPVTISAALKDVKTGSAIAGQSLALELRISSTEFRQIKSATTAADGSVSVTVTPSGSSEYVWVYGGNRAHKGAVSEILSVKVV